MYICVCRAITERQILSAIDDGSRTMRELRRQFDLCSACGKCGPCVRDVLAAALPSAGPSVEDGYGEPQMA